MSGIQKPSDRHVFTAAWTLLAMLSATAVQAGIDVKVNSDLPGDVQNEVRIAIDPGNSQNLMIAYNDRNGSVSPNPLGVSYSSDGGVTWTDNQLSVPADPFGLPGSTLPQIFDPILTGAPGGDFFAGYIATNGVGSGSSGLYVERSEDGGVTWSAPTQVDANPPAAGPFPDPNYRFNDRPHMVADLAGLLHVTWIKDVGQAGPTSDIYYNASLLPPGPGPAPSPPAGLSFLPTSVIVNDNPNGTDWANVPYVAPHPNGTTYVAWINYDVTVANTSSGTLMLDKATVNPTPPLTPVFGTDIAVRPIDPLPRFVSTAAGYGTFDDARAQSYPVIAVDGNDPSANTVYMAYAEEVPGALDEGDIFFIKSTDGGNSWTIPIRVNDDFTNHDQMHPEIILKGDGTIDIAWYDKRNGLNDDAWDVYIAKSIDGGNSFSQNVRVSDTTFATPTAIGGSPPWLGEYLGLTTDGTNAYVGFTSGVNDSNGDVYFDSIPNAQIPEPTSIALAVFGLLSLIGFGRRVRR